MSYEHYLLNLWAWRGVVERYGLAVAGRNKAPRDLIYSVVNDREPGCDAVELLCCSLSEYTCFYEKTLECLVVALVNAYQDRDEIQRLCFSNGQVYSLQAGRWKHGLGGISEEAIRQVRLESDRNAWFDVRQWSSLGHPVAH